jgi:hypothetical protein
MKVFSVWDTLHKHLILEVMRRKRVAQELLRARVPVLEEDIVLGNGIEPFRTLVRSNAL